MVGGGKRGARGNFFPKYPSLVLNHSGARIDSKLEPHKKY